MKKTSEKNHPKKKPGQDRQHVKVLYFRSGPSAPVPGAAPRARAVYAAPGSFRCRAERLCVGVSAGPIGRIAPSSTRYAPAPKPHRVPPPAPLRYSVRPHAPPAPPASGCGLVATLPRSPPPAAPRFKGGRATPVFFERYKKC